MSQDIHGQYQGQLFGYNRLGHTSPDAEATETFRPWIPVGYPAPWLPMLRQDQGHPVIASVVISNQQVVGVDKSGALVPAGMFCGTQATKALGGLYYALKYAAADVGFAYNPITRALVATAGEVAVIAAPSDGAAADVITFADGSTYTVTAGDVTNAKACDLFTSGVVKPIGITIRPVWQYLGGVIIDTTQTASIKYTLDGVVPMKFRVHNYMHEMATAIQTEYTLRLPWIGDNPSDLQTLATSLGLTAAQYTQTAYSRAFTHFTGPKGAAAGQLHVGALVKGSNFVGDAGNFTPWNQTNDKFSDVCGRILGIEEMYPAKDYMNRVRTLWDNSRMVGPLKEQNTASIMMGGSQTAGLPYALGLGTDNLLSAAINNGKTPSSKMYTFVYVRIFNL